MGRLEESSNDQSDVGSEESFEEDQADVASRESSQGQADVALALGKHLLQTIGKDSNVVFSPFSVQVVLSLLASAAKGPTLDQLLSFLRSESPNHINSHYSKILDAVLEEGTVPGGPKLSVVNGVWVDKSLSLKTSFKEVVDNVYKAACSHVDFQNKAKEVETEVNSWAEKETAGLIKELIPSGSVSPITRLILGNALYFKASWTKRFDASDTEDGDFYLLDGSSVCVPFMTSCRKQLVSVFDGFKVLELPYARCGDEGEYDYDDNRHFSMFIFLPDAKDGLPNLVEKVGSETGFLDRHIPQKYVEVGEFWIPKFKISSGFRATERLKELGLVLPLSEEADLSEMVESPVDPMLYVNEVFHKSSIEVNEQGTEAAAAAVFYVGIGAGWNPNPPPPVDFVADYPFLFLIREDTTGTVLFIGHVLDPSRSD